MALVNEHFLKLPENSLFADLDKKINSFKITHHQAELIYLNRNDAVCPIPPAASAALHKAVDELCKAETFKGYSPIQGYDFLIDTILKHDYQARGISFSPTEIFINDGSKSDIGNFGDILRHDNSIGVTDSSYPFYIDSNAMCGRAGCIQPEDGKWSNVVYIPCDNEKGFIPQLPGCRVDIIYLSNPIFPTGALLTKQELKKWVNYALENDTLILYDAAFEPFIQHPDIPHSIFEIKGARKVAIEFKSYSKAAGFSGIRCGYTVVPKEVSAAKLTGERKQLNSMWRRRQEIKFNGASYMAQRAAEALYTPEGKEQTNQCINYYRENIRIMTEACWQYGLTCHSSPNFPFVWIKTPSGKNSWKFFEEILYNTYVVCTPGALFGPGGEGYIQLSAYCTHEACAEAMKRLGKDLI